MTDVYPRTVIVNAVFPAVALVQAAVISGMLLAILRRPPFKSSDKRTWSPSVHNGPRALATAGRTPTFNVGAAALFVLVPTTRVAPFKSTDASTKFPSAYVGAAALATVVSAICPSELGAALLVVKVPRIRCRPE